jgi:hypothetical protein
VRHHDGQHRLPSGVSGREGRPPARARDLRSAVLVLGNVLPARVGAMTFSGRRGSASTTAVHPQRDAALHAAGRH